MSTESLPKGHVRKFENDEYLAHIDNDPLIGRDVYVVTVRGKLPNGTQFRMAEDFRDTYDEARALVTEICGL